MIKYSYMLFYINQLFEKNCYTLLIESKMKRAIVFNDLLKLNTWHTKMQIFHLFCPLEIHKNKTKVSVNLKFQFFNISNLQSPEN